jgi:hemoglobin
VSGRLPGGGPIDYGRPVATVYEAAGGEQGLIGLARAWHERVMSDEIVSHAFHGGARPDHAERLAAYWAEGLGGPALYTERYGNETSVVRLHSGNGPHEEMNERAIACFDAALGDIGIGRDEPAWRALHEYFAWSTPEVNRFERSAGDVPDGLQIPHWSWDGLVRAPVQDRPAGS